MNKDRLMRISTYARREGFSVQWVYKLIETNNLKCVIIDGVKFIEL